ncbi:MAG: hypothetical protein ACJ76F_10385, partial [Bacteroidia bacterium]
MIFFRGSYHLFLFAASLFVFSISFAQDFSDMDYNKAALTLKQFKLRNDSLGKMFERDKQKPLNYSFTYADAIYFEYSGNKDSLNLLYKELRSGMAFGSIAQKHGFKESEDYFICYLKKPKIEAECFHKLIFHTIPRLNRYDNIVMDLNNEQQDPAKYKKGTRLIDTLDGGLTCTEFLSPYKKAVLPEFMSRGMFYYETITGSKEPAFYKLDRLRNYNLPELAKLKTLWEDHPAVPVAPVDPGNMNELQKDSFSIVKKNYADTITKRWEEQCLVFQARVLKDVELVSFLNKLIKVPAKCIRAFPTEVEVKLECLGLKAEMPDYVAPAPGYRRLSSRRLLLALVSATERQNGQGFAQNAYFCKIDKPETAFDSLLSEISLHYYQHPELFECGYIASGLLSSNGDWSYNLRCVGQVENSQVKLKVISEIEAWLSSKP